jgi:hypothetical protein
MPSLIDYNRLPTSFKNAVPYLFASIVYHHDFLRANLGAHHPLWSSRMFISRYDISNSHLNASVIDFFKPRVLVGTYRCPATGMTASGVPNHVVVLRRLDKLEEGFGELKKTMLSVLARLEALIQQQSKTIPVEVKDMMLSSFNIEGIQGPTRDEFRYFQESVSKTMELRFSALEALVQRIENGSALTARTPNNLSSVNNQQSSQPAGNRGQYDIFYWDGMMHVYPKGFSIQDLTVKQAWFLWHFGDRVRNMMPMSKFSSHNAFKNNRKDQANYSKVKMIICDLQRTVRENNMIEPSKKFEELSNTEMDECYNAAFKVYIDYLYEKDKSHKYAQRPDQVQICTLANRRYKRTGEL